MIKVLYVAGRETQETIAVSPSCKHKGNYWNVVGKRRDTKKKNPTLTFTRHFRWQVTRLVQWCSVRDVFLPQELAVNFLSLIGSWTTRLVTRHVPLAHVPQIANGILGLAEKGNPFSSMGNRLSFIHYILAFFLPLFLSPITRYITQKIHTPNVSGGGGGGVAQFI